MRRLTLLRPLLYSTKNRFFFTGNMWHAAGLVIFCLAVCLAIYLITLKVVLYFHAQNELGIILSLKIFSMAWIIMFAMHIFSCMVSAVSGLFLSLDNEIVFAAPVRPAEIFSMRYVATFIHTSWMTVIFSIPFYAAFGRVFEAGPLYLPLMLCAILAVSMIAVGFGLLVTIILVKVFPARRTKDIILYLSLCFAIFIYVMFRMIRPELLANPDQFSTFVDYLSTISSPSGSYVPGAWAANMLSSYLLDREIDWLLLSLLLTTPLTLFFIGEWTMEALFFSGYSKSQESFGGHRRFKSKTGPTLSRWRWLAAKEAKSLLRDSAEWSQLFMVAALVIVYLYNFKVLPLDRSFWREEYLTNLISFLNIGLTGFVATSLAARFVLPSIGAEGGSFYIIQSSPLTVHQFLLFKFFFYCIPFTTLSILLVTVSDYLLKISGPLLWISIFSSIVISITVVALALAFGSFFANFKAENRAAAQSGFGAIFFLLSALTYEGLVLGSGAYPVYQVTRSWLRDEPPQTFDLLMTAGWMILTLVGSLLLIRLSLRKAADKLTG